MVINAKCDTEELMVDTKEIEDMIEIESCSRLMKETFIKDES